jgi:glyoxylase-like metal-dependent hydrolase (beta-lactamase superfamily II)
MAARKLSAQDEATVEGHRLAAEAGIHPIVLSTPWGIGPVNTYLIEDDPVTLVDCGPNSATVLGELEKQLAEHGYRLGDLGLVVITHHHMDHCGLAGALADRTNAEIACLDLLAPGLRDWEAFLTQDDDDAHATMLLHGVEPRVADALRAVADVVRSWGAPSPVHRELADGGRLQLRDRTFDLHHRPGHSSSDLMLVDPASRIALSGDHLISHVSSNAVIARPLTPWDGGRPQTLVQYRRSLTATRALDTFDIMLGGHFAPVLDHKTLIDERIAAQDRRAERFLTYLEDGPQSAHEIATRRWGGEVAVTQAFLTVSEVLGHLDLLIAEGLVVEDRTQRPVRFRLAG